MHGKNNAVEQDGVLHHMGKEVEQWATARRCNTTGSEQWRAMPRRAHDVMNAMVDGWGVVTPGDGRYGRANACHSG